jgi:hypothetical protein
MGMKRWVKEGIAFGLLLFIINIILHLFYYQAEGVTLKFVLIMFPLSLLGGLGYGYTMGWVRTKLSDNS